MPVEIKFGRRTKGFKKDKAALRLFWGKNGPEKQKRPWGGVCGPSGRLGGAAAPPRAELRLCQTPPHGLFASPAFGA